MEGRLTREENNIGVAEVLGGLITGRSSEHHHYNRYHHHHHDLDLNQRRREVNRGQNNNNNNDLDLRNDLDLNHHHHHQDDLNHHHHHDLDQWGGGVIQGHRREVNQEEVNLMPAPPAAPPPPQAYPYPPHVPAPGGECWSAVFAPDGSRLAWSCGYRKVILLPWNRYKNCLQSEDSLDPRGVPLSAERVSLDAGFPVTSLAFGTGVPEKELRVKRDYWLRFDYTKDLILATGHANGRIRIWDPYNGKLLLELTDHTKPVTDLAFAPDGSLRLSSASRDGTIKVWDMSDDGNMFKTLREHMAPVRALAWSPDAAMLVSAGDKQRVLLWDMVGYRLARRLSGHFNTVLSCCFSPDGALVATASCDTRVMVWDPNSGTPLRVFHHLLPPPGVIYMSGANSSAALDVTFSPTGCHLASICSDGFLRYWDLTTDSDLPSSEGSVLQGDSMLNCTFSPLGGAVCVGHESGSLIFYSAPTHIPSLLHLARMSVRKAVSSPSSLPSLPLPSALLPYLTYRRL